MMDDERELKAMMLRQQQQLIHQQQMLQQVLDQQQDLLQKLSAGHQQTVQQISCDVQTGTIAPQLQRVQKDVGRLLNAQLQKPGTVCNRMVGSFLLCTLTWCGFI